MAGNDPYIPPTVVMPNPGGAAPAQRPFGAFGDAPAFGAGLSAGAGSEFDAAEARPGVNPLVDAAADLFDLVVYLQSQAQPVAIEPLKDKTLALVRRFENKAAEAGVEPTVADVARYAVAATIDDQIMAKPWGLQSGWQNQTLVAALYGEVIGGERFFEFLEEAERAPDRFGDLIEFMYLCLSLGFQGVYRRSGGAPGQGVEGHRGKAFEAIRMRRDGLPGALSVRWRGVDAIRKPFREIVPLWLAGAVSLAVTAGLFFLAVFMIGGETARAVTAAGDIPPVAEVAIETLDPPAKPPPPPPPQPQQKRVEGFLEDEIAQGLVSVFEEGGQLRIRIAGEGMFASARATLLPRYEAVLSKVATALNGEPGRVVVEGHSDAAPIKTARFPSNFHLSEARAAAVAAFMRPLLANPDRLDVIGLGATQLLDQQNPRGAVNRRVELVLEAQPTIVTSQGN